MQTTHWEGGENGRLVAFLALFWVLFLLCGGFEKYENDLLDLLFRLRGPLKPAHENIVIVGISTSDLLSFGPMPWDRAVFSRVLMKLKNLGARGCAMDVLFNEQGPNPESDRLLAEAMGKIPVFLPLVCVQEMVLNQDTFELEKRTILEKPTELFAKQCRGFGTVDIQLQEHNFDGVVRQFPIEREIEGKKIPSLALAFFSLMAGQSHSCPTYDSLDFDLFCFDSKGWRFFQWSSHSTILINWRGPAESFPSITVSDLLRISDEEGARLCAGRFIYLGAYDIRGVRDIKITPFGPMPGVEIHANLLQNILNGNAVRRLSTLTTVLYTLLFSFLLFHACRFFPEHRSGILFLLFIPLYFLICLFLHWHFECQLPLAAPLSLFLVQLFLDRLVRSHRLNTRFALREEAIQTELSIARDIQKKLYPTLFPGIPGYDFAGENLSADAVGGDYFDFIPLGDGRIALVIGDVSGHGVPAALLMAMAKSGTLLGLRMNPQPDKLLVALNHLIFETMKRKRMMTCFVGILNPDTHQLEFSNGGHNFPVRVGLNGDSRFLALIATPLGIRENGKFGLERISLAKGELICFYTDGSVESKNPKGEMYGYERLIAFLEAKRSAASAADIVTAFFEDLATFSEGEPYDDDITFAILRRLYPDRDGREPQ